MAIIECSHCGEKVSDHAPICPHCGCRLINEAERQEANDGAQAANGDSEVERNMTSCPYCGATISKRAIVCPSCGEDLNPKDPIPSADTEKALFEEEGKHEGKSRTNIVLFALNIILLGVAYAWGLYLWA